MSKYRIKKHTEVYADKEVSSYIVQKRVLWVWVNAQVVQADYNLGSRTTVDIIVPVCRTLEEAEKVKDHLENPYTEIYFGNKIHRVLDSAFDFIYINRSKSWDGGYYECSKGINTLKKSIRSRTVLRQTTTIV